MAHPGRLNLLVNIMGKMPGDLFAEFEGKHAEGLTDGDVRYHNGFSSDVSTRGGPVHLSLAFSPSHLEIVSPVVEGQRPHARNAAAMARASRCYRCWCPATPPSRARGVVMETLNLAQTRGYGTGGTLHRHQQPDRLHHLGPARLALDALYLHRRGQDDRSAGVPRQWRRSEAVMFATRLALDYRMQFRHDVVIDIVCFRKLEPATAGHPR